MLINADPYKSFMPYSPQTLEKVDDGPLSGRTFAAKDIMRVEGYPTSGGNPTWAEHFGGSKLPTADCVQKLLNAGAECMGKTITDELAYNHLGINAHYGTPINPKAPGRVCGGSSSGSASAVGGALVDFALGTDTGGSVRGPASFCGIWGIRTSHGRVNSDGVMPLAPSYDTIGWFARNNALMEQVGAILLGPDNTELTAEPILQVPDDVIELLDIAHKDGFNRFLNQFKDRGGQTEHINIMTDDDFDTWFDTFRVTQGAEVWEAHKKWVIDFQPELGPGVYERFEMISELSNSEIAPAKFKRVELARALQSHLTSDKIIVMPSTLRTAFPRKMSVAEINASRKPHVGLMAFSGIAGVPQVSMPLLEVDGAPYGISLMGPKGSDMALLALAGRVSKQVGTIY